MKAHHERIISVIQNRNNNGFHLKGIRRMIDNFNDRYGFNELWLELQKEYCELQKRVIC